MTTMRRDPDWPYEEIEDDEPLPSEPSWVCSAGSCACHDPRAVDPETASFSILLCDERGRRMPGARCRVLAGGILLNEARPNADASGRIVLDCHRLPEQVIVEWAPAHTPLEPRYPHRKLYHVQLPRLDPKEASRRRLHNLGFTERGKQEDNTRDFQRAYGQTVTGELADAYPELVAYHDDGQDRPSHRGAADVALALAAEGEGPLAGPSPGGGPNPGKLVPSAPAPRVMLTGLQFGSIEDQTVVFDTRRSLFEGSDELKESPLDLHDLKGWGKGKPIEALDWIAGRKGQLSPCLLRKSTIGATAMLKWAGDAPVTVKVTVTPTLDGDKTQLTVGVAELTFTAGGDRSTDILFGGALPDHVGRLHLRLDWSFEDTKDDGNRIAGFTTSHLLFVRFGEPLLPHFDADDEGDGGKPANNGTTVTGTMKRFDKLRRLIDSDFKHSVHSTEFIDRMLWNIHRGINDHRDQVGTQPDPPFFQAEQDIQLTHTGNPPPFAFISGSTWRGGNPLHVEHQWLMWINSDPTSAKPDGHWNRSSCIGHVQLLKTMAAALGVYVRRVWVLPKTEVIPSCKRVPGGGTEKLAEQDLYYTGAYLDDKGTPQQSKLFAKMQTEELRLPNGDFVKATVKLMEPKGYENFEACARTPGGKLLPGGYAVSRITADSPAFLVRRGFRSAREVLAWWTATKRDTFQRFMAWVRVDDSLQPTDCWDRDGKHYSAADFQKIFDTGKHLPPP